MLFFVCQTHLLWRRPVSCTPTSSRRFFPNNHMTSGWRRGSESMVSEYTHTHSFSSHCCSLDLIAPRFPADVLDQPPSLCRAVSGCHGSIRPFFIPKIREKVPHPSV